MRTKLVILVIFGFFLSLMVNAQHGQGHGKGQGQGRGGGGGHGGGHQQVMPRSPPMNVAPRHTAPMNIAPRHTAPIQNAPMNTAPMNAAPVSQPRIQINQPAVQNVTPNAVNNRPMRSTWQGRTSNHRNYHHQGRGHSNNQNYYHRKGHHRLHNQNQNYGTTTVIYPYYYPYVNYDYGYGYGYPQTYYDTSQTSEDQNVYYVCYQIDQIQENLYQINCPKPVSWYSTNPSYNSAEYQTTYRPQYACPNHGAPYYLEFATTYDATTWANNYCDRNVQASELPQ